MKPHPYLTHYIRIAKQDKNYAWWAVNELAEQNPGDHSGLPRLLTEAMQSAKSPQTSKGSALSTPAKEG